MSIRENITILLVLSLIGGTLWTGTAQDKTDSQRKKQPTSQNSNTDISDAELKKFSKALENVKAANKKSQQKMRDIIQEEGLTIKKYQAIYKAKQDPSKESQASSQEMKKYKAAEKRIKKIRKTNKKEVEEGIKQANLTPKRYKEIYSAVRQNKALQEKVMQMQKQRK